MAAIKPFKIGDRVISPTAPRWGIGVVVEEDAYPLSAKYGQRLVVNFKNRGRVSVKTTLRQLVRVEDDPDT